MIGTIRKHSKWLWFVIAGLTIFSFVVFMGSGPVHNGSGPSSQNPLGTIYGKPVTQREFSQAQGEFFIYYRLHYGQWPDENASVTHDDIERETYFRLLLARKAEQLDIHVSDEALVAAAADFLKNIGQNGQPVPMQEFVQRYLAPRGFTVTDLQNFLRDELVVQQLIQTLGLSGALVTPQEAGLMYDRENREVSAQAVFFSASNYLAKATVTPAAIATFYTNNMAAYREPDRVQVSYVAFEASNYLEQAKAEWAKTNFADTVDAIYNQRSAEYADAKTPEEAKGKIREQLIHYRALMDARQTANEFATELFAMEPVKTANFAALAAKKKLTVRTTAPFDANYGPSDLNAPSTFTKSAFDLTTEVPFAGPIVGQDGVYLMSLAGKFPSTIPPLDQIRPQVTRDLQQQEAIALARGAGTNFYVSLTVQMSLGKTFAQAAVAAAQVPLVLPPFSLSTPDLPEIGDHADIRQVKQAAFTTQPGHASNFIPTMDGGFVLFVQEMLPLDEAKKAADMPRFLTQVRNARQNEAFNLWIRGEANRELQDTPLFKKETATNGAAANAAGPAK
jgi:hypothetical protein